MHKCYIRCGFLKHRFIQSPPANVTRPTSNILKEAIFNVLQHKLYYDFNNSSVIDLFAGFGALGIESISVGSKNVLFVDSSKIATECIKGNLMTLKIETFASIVCENAELVPDKFIFDFTKTAGSVLIFFDPPYGKTDCLIEQVLRLQKLFTGKAAVFVIESNQKIHLSGFNAVYNIRHGKTLVSIAVL
ncbi:MAG: RsmD family RNA methyltransferase [Holosporales bacterium]|jgi:16S rRNA (guanine966-N2)-methyltransferase|nr:RsmD family RNA methyltransferase [Holosporales bacterium]